MYVGMLIYVPLGGLLPSSLQQIGMALFYGLANVRLDAHPWTRLEPRLRDGRRHAHPMGGAPAGGEGHLSDRKSVV